MGNSFPFTMSASACCSEFLRSYFLCFVQGFQLQLVGKRDGKCSLHPETKVGLVFLDQIRYFIMFIFSFPFLTSYLLSPVYTFLYPHLLFSIILLILLYSIYYLKLNSYLIYIVYMKITYVHVYKVYMHCIYIKYSTICTMYTYIIYSTYFIVKGHEFPIFFFLYSIWTVYSIY